MELKDIDFKKKKLADTKKVLKKKFIGLDNVIDKIIDELQTWYCCPEIIKHPTIINLWGLTGVGKTDLVRNIRDELEMNESYCEVTFDESSSSAQLSTKIDAKLEEKKPGILLLDEIQRFRCKDESGAKLRNVPYMDVWDLLSDGKLKCDDSDDMLTNMMLEYDDYKLRLKEYEDNLKAVAEGLKPIKDAGKKQQKDEFEALMEEDDDDEGLKAPVLSDSYYFSDNNLYMAKRLKKTFRLKESAFSIAKWTAEKKLKILQKNQDNHKGLNAEYDFSKLLIFISGNLDKAYNMATRLGSDIPADFYHEISKTINIHDIKQALQYSFQPEQIARFGNTHIIYPALSEDNFCKIIKQKCDSYTAGIKKDFKIKMTIDESVQQLIYRNGVFPSQGTRPVFSTIKSILESKVTDLLFKMLSGSKSKECNITYNLENRELLLIDGDNLEYKREYNGEIDELKEMNASCPDTSRMIQVHEAGHAVAYGLLTGLSPIYTITLVSNSKNSGGYIMQHQFLSSKKNIKDRIMILLASRCAEEMVFGKDYISSGASADIEQATILANSYLRLYGMGDNIHKVAHETEDDGFLYDTDVNETNVLIKQMLRELKEKAMSMLNKNIHLYTSVVCLLKEKNRVTEDEMVEIFANHNIKINKLPINKTKLEDYSGLFNQWKGEQNER